MAWAKATQITAWSFSRYNGYRQCPFKLKLSAIDKIKEPQSAPMLRGDGIHKLAEAYLKAARAGKVPAELEKVGDELKRLRKIVKKETMAAVEENWAFRKDWSRTTWNDWNECWVRIKLDMAHPEAEAVVVTDWKTGKFRPESQEEYLEQLDLYGLGALLIYAGRPGLVVRPRLVYTDLGRIYPNCVDEPVVEYRPEDLPKLKKTWEKRVKPMLADKTFAPKPNKYCYSCFYRNSNKANGGGQCKM